MSKPRGYKRGQESRWIDQLLTLGLTEITLLALGQALQAQMIAWIMMSIAAAGTLFSYFGFVHRTRSQHSSIDAIFLVLTAVGCVSFSGFLIALAPNDAFGGSLAVTGLLAWFLTFSSFFQWTDSTRMFQAVPCIALFGLLGVYDTFGGAVIAFFVFLFFLAWQFSRTHSRAMLKNAYESGFSRIDEGTALDKSSLEQDAMLRAMRRGPWRMMAGPEWGLLSAAVIVLVSLIGAPIIQASVTSVTGEMSVALPHRLRPKNNNSPVPVNSNSFQNVGTGPVHLSDQVLGVANLKDPVNLQQNAYGIYTGHGWQQDQAQTGPAVDPKQEMNIVSQASQDLFNSKINAIVRRVPLPFQITLFSDTVSNFPVPQTLASISEPSQSLIMGDGSVPLRTGSQYNTQVQGIYLRSEQTPGSSSNPNGLKAYPDDQGVITTNRVRKLVAQITHGLPNDWAKANAIKNAISSRCQYNINTPAYPPNQDSVDYFLFTAKQGYCEMFATAMTVMARCAGIKANYNVGYALSPDDRDSQGNYRIRANDAHAWSTLEFHDVGWVVFDATENATEVSETGFWASQLGMGLLVLGGFGLTLAAVGFGLMITRRIGKLGQKKSAREIALQSAGQAYTQFITTLERKAKIPKKRGQTIEEYAREASPFCVPFDQEMGNLATDFEQVFYSPEGAKLERSMELKERVKELKESLKKVKSSR